MGPETRPRRGREAGLTLLEMLVALGLLGLLLALLQDGFTLGHRVWDRAASRLGPRIDAVEAAQSLLRDRLARAHPAFTLADDGRVSLEGDARSLVFDAPAPLVLGQGTYLRYRLAVDEAGGLALAWLPDTERSRLAEPARSVLLEGVAGLDLAYFGARRGLSAPPRWHDSWRGQPAMPALIRLRVLFPPGDERVWPELLVAPRAVADATCAWDPTERGCAGRRR